MRRAGVFLLSVVMWTGTSGAQFVAPGGVIPVVANLQGQNDTYWRSDVSIINVSQADTTVVLEVFPEIVGGQPAFEATVSNPISIPAAGQLTLTNVLQTRFQLINTKGALWVRSTDGEPLVISSRTYTEEAGGTYGQDVDSVLVSHTAWASGLRHDGFYRSNVGIFWPWDLVAGDSVSFEVTAFSSQGEAVGTTTMTFTASVAA